MCQSCEALTINGVYCHEIGCPDSWKDYKRECFWCASEFQPEERAQAFCDQSCAESYNGDNESFMAMESAMLGEE